MFKNKVLPFILVNAFFIVMLFLCIIPTLFYTQVPLNQQHLWFGNNLHDYLVYQHALITIVWSIMDLIANYVVIEKVRGLK